MENLNPSISQHLESFAESARKLENALSEEKKKNQKIAAEYISTRTTLENGVRELKKRLAARDEKIQAITVAYTTLQKSNTDAQTALNGALARETTTNAELTQFKNAWSEVLARETEARKTLIEFEKAKRTLGEQRNQITTLETALSETNRASSAQIAALGDQKKSLENRVALLAQNEAALKQALSDQESRLRIGLKKELVSEKSRVQELARNHLNAEVTRVTNQERRAAEVKVLEVNQEMKLLQNRLEDLDRSRHQEIERARSRLLALTEESHKKSLQIDAMSGDIQLLQRELNQTKLAMEQVRKDSSKAILIEHLRHEQQTHELQSKIEHLMNEGIYAEKANSMPEGMPVFEARPVSESEGLSALSTARESGNAPLRGHFS